MQYRASKNQLHDCENSQGGNHILFNLEIRKPKRSKIVLAAILSIFILSNFALAETGEANLDNDDSEGDIELYCEDPSLAPGQVTTEDRDDDGDFDIINIGTSGGGVIFGQIEIDGANDIEIIVADPTLETGEILRADADNDGDPEVIWVGTAGADFDGDEEREVEESGAIVAIFDIDDSGDNEVIIADTSRQIGDFNAASFNIGGNDAVEFVWIGILTENERSRGATFQEIRDFDGDGEKEIIFEDIRVIQTEPSFGGIFIDVDGDGDDDVIIELR